MYRYLPRDDGEESYGGDLTEDELAAWVEEARYSRVQRLGKGNFDNDVLNGEDLWIVDFSAGSWCGPCSQLKGPLRRVSNTLAGVAKVGLVDCDRNRQW